LIQIESVVLILVIIFTDKDFWVIWSKNDICVWAVAIHQRLGKPRDEG